jgi:hypothetical protein
VRGGVACAVRQVGTDPRLSGPALMDALVAGLARCALLGATPWRVRSHRLCPTDERGVTQPLVVMVCALRALPQRRLHARAHGHRHHARLLHELHHAWCVRRSRNYCARARGARVCLKADAVTLSSSRLVL